MFKKGKNGNYLIALLFMLAYNFTQAQSLFYKKAESASSEISKIQKEADGYTFKDSTENIELSFPKENFKIWADDLLASHAVYQKKNNNEILLITEKIDLTKATSFVIYNADSMKNNWLYTYRLYFSNDTLTTSVYQNGNFIKQIKKKYLDIYLLQPNVNYYKSSELVCHKFYNRFIYLINQLKTEKGQTLQYNMQDIEYDWNNTIDVDKIADFTKFKKKYPNSIYDKECDRNLVLLKNEADELLRNQTYANKFAEKYKFKKGLDVLEMKAFNPVIGRITNTGSPRHYQYKNDKYFTFEHNYSIFGNPWPVGPLSITFKNQKSDSYSYINYTSKNRTEVINMFNKLINDFSNVIDRKYIKKNESHEFNCLIEVPGAENKISFTIINPEGTSPKWVAIMISFN